jgi:Flp pilus assembly pilin Flp
VIEKLNELIPNESGLATTEYAIAGALISIALVGAFTFLSGGIGNAVADLASALLASRS